MSVSQLLMGYANYYESSDFIVGDPSWFMHQVKGLRNQEAMAFVASSLSYGNRGQFLPKITRILESSGGEMDEWIRSGSFAHFFNANDTRCFYRLFTYSSFYVFLNTYSLLLKEYGSLGDYVRIRANDGYSAIVAICDYFRNHGSGGVIPKNTTSACKRLCMFLRWMVRPDSPVDLGIWSFIDRRSLLIPLDTHVLQEARRIGLLNSSTASMNTCKRLTEKLSLIFPDDPLRGDFALFGYGIDHGNR